MQRLREDPPYLMSFLSKDPQNREKIQGDALDALASLFAAAKEDDALRKQILFLANAPVLHRMALVNGALHEMALRNEPQAVQLAFSLLSTDEGANAALEILSEG